MSTAKTLNLRKGFMTVLKGILHVAIYIVVGLALAFFFNSMAQAAELNYSDYIEYPLYYTEDSAENENMAADYADYSEYYQSEPQLYNIHADYYSEPPPEYVPGTSAEDLQEIIRAFMDEFMSSMATETPLIEPEIEPAPLLNIPYAPPDGRLLITNRAQADRGQTGAALSGAIFEVRGIMDDYLIAQLRTDHFGEATVNLPAGDYYIRKIVPATGFVADFSRANVRIVAGELRSVSITSTAEIIAVADAIPEVEAEPSADGRLLVTLMSGATSERLTHGTITVHDIMTDEHIATISSDFFGEASVFLPAGRYFMRQSSMPQGYLPNFDRIPFTINAGAITDISLVIRAEPVPVPPPAPPTTSTQTAAPAQTAPPVASPAVIESVLDNEVDTQGMIEIVTRAAGSGNPLSGGIFAVYRAYDSRRIAELTTGAGGKAYLITEPGLYFIRELRPTFGFYLETERIFLEVGAGETVTVELTKVRDMSIADLPPDTEGGGIIYITQTGQFMSMFHYIGGSIMLLITMVCMGILGRLLIKEYKNKKNEGGKVLC